MGIEIGDPAPDFTLRYKHVALIGATFRTSDLAKELAAIA